MAGTMKGQIAMSKYELPPPRGPEAARVTLCKAGFRKRLMARRIIWELCGERECSQRELAEAAVLGDACVKCAIAQEVMTVVATEYADNLVGFDWAEIIALIMAILELILEWFSV